MSTSSSANQAGLGSVGAGAAAGAAIGSVVPGVGTVIGASVGAAVGGIAGSIGLGKKAKKNAKRAQAIQREREQNAQEATYLQMIRQARMARAGSLAASTSYGLASSSLTTSALSSIGSQSQYSVQYTANDQRLLELYNSYMKKAGAYAKSAQTTLAAGQLASLAIGVGGSAISAGMTAGMTAGNAAGNAAVGEMTGAQVLSEGTSGAYWSGFGEGVGNYFSSGAYKPWMYASLFMSPVYQGIGQYNQI